MYQVNPAIAYPSIEYLLNIYEQRRALGQYGIPAQDLYRYAHAAVSEMYLPYIQMLSQSLMQQESFKQRQKELEMEAALKRELFEKQLEASRLELERKAQLERERLEREWQLRLLQLQRQAELERQLKEREWEERMKQLQAEAKAREEMLKTELEAKKQMQEKELGTTVQIKKEEAEAMEKAGTAQAIGSAVGLAGTAYLASKVAGGTAAAQAAEEAVSSAMASASGTSLAGLATTGLTAGAIGAGAALLTGSEPKEAVKVGAGAAVGAAIGSYIMPGIGTVVGGIIGGAVGKLFRKCIIISALHGDDSEEVQIAREFRDKYLDIDTLRGYYFLSELITPRMDRDAKYRQKVQMMVNKLIEYGRGILRGEKYSEEAETTAKAFLSLCRSIGKNLPVIIRSNGEII